MRERIETWLRRRPNVVIVFMIVVAIVVAIVLPELLRVTGVDGPAASAIKIGSTVAVLAGFAAVLWFVSAPVRRLIADARSGGDAAYLVEASSAWLGAKPRSRWSDEIAPALLVADAEGVSIRHGSHVVFFARWSQLEYWSAEHGNTLTFSVDGEWRRIQFFDERLLYPASRKRVAAIAAELDARRLAARAAP